MEEYTCDYCGAVNEDYPSKIGRYENEFCDSECQRMWQKERPPEEHNWYKGGPAEVECSNCGKKLERKPCVAEDYDNFYCSRECQSEHKSKILRGENHPRWKGGVRISYGPNWKEQRQKRIERDNSSCAICGMSNGEHKQVHGCELHVHHIQPAMNFLQDGNMIDYERANRLENLITLCYKCHGRWEGVGLRPEVKK